MEIHLAHTQGFCAGVALALKIVDKALSKYGTPIYIRHHIVHNTSIIQDLEKKGIIFVDNLENISDDSLVIFSAHGVAPQVFKEAKAKNLRVIDATCPLVRKLHRNAQKFNEQKIPIILIGHENHQEIIGTSGYIDQDNLYLIESIKDLSKLSKLDRNQPIAYLTQTTLSLSETADILTSLKSLFPNLIMHKGKDICYATENRQNAVIELAKKVDLVIICGSKNSSNSVRLAETAQKYNPHVILIDFPADLDLNLLKEFKKIGISSGASVPGNIVASLIERIKTRYQIIAIKQEPSIEKKTSFNLPLV